MTRTEFWKKLGALIITCDVNQRYHQTTAWNWKAFDRITKILVAVMAVAALCLTVAHDESIHVLEIIFGSIASIAAIALNVVPFGEYEKSSDEMFHSWSDVRKDAEIQSLKFSSVVDISECMIERLGELVAKVHSLNAIEPTPNRKRLRKCQEDCNESIWGVRSHEEAQKKQAEASATATSSLVAEKAVARVG